MQATQGSQGNSRVSAHGPSSFSPSQSNHRGTVSSHDSQSDLRQRDLESLGTSHNLKTWLNQTPRDEPWRPADEVASVAPKASHGNVARHIVELEGEMKKSAGAEKTKGE